MGRGESRAHAKGRALAAESGATRGGDPGVRDEPGAGHPRPDPQSPGLDQHDRRARSGSRGPQDGGVGLLRPAPPLREGQDERRGLQKGTSEVIDGN